MKFLNNLKIFIKYMVLYIHSVSLYASCSFIKIKKNLVLRAKQSNSYILCIRNQRKHILLVLRRVLDHAFTSNLLYYQ